MAKANDYPDSDINSIFEEVKKEAGRALEKYGPFKSLHEAYAVILEESEELWETIRKKQPGARTREEAIQLAAAVILMIQDLDSLWGPQSSL